MRASQRSLQGKPDNQSAGLPLQPVSPESRTQCMQKELADTVLDVDAVGNELAGQSNSVDEGLAEETLMPFANGEESEARADQNLGPVRG